MATTSLARDLGSLFQGSSAAGLTDRNVIERFATHRDETGEAAFAALVARHVPMVLGVCRQILGDQHQAEDAFQAVFLVLAVKARSLREPDLLGKWLYGVAVRTARCARLRCSRRRRAEEMGSARQAATVPAAPTADRILLDGEGAEALHREIDRLPGSFRLPVVLCYFEGLTLDEAAHRLRWPVGTTRSRLARAREKLRRGLTRRGFALSTAAIAAMLAPRSAQPSVSSVLCDSTTRAAIAFAARHVVGGALSAHAAALAQEVLLTMLLHKLKATAISLLLLATVVVGAVYYSLNAFAQSREGEPPGEPNARTEPRPPEGPQPAAGHMLVAGRVLDPDGRPLPNARVAVLADRKRQVGDLDGRHRNILMGTAAADADGRFALEFPAIPAPHMEHLSLIAVAPGRVLTAVDLKTDVERQETSITLPAEELVEGRLVDVQGQPAVGVVIRLAKLILGRERQPYDAKEAPNLWPTPATTDSGGRFRMLGLHANTPATFEVDDPRYAREMFSFGADAARDGEGVLRSGSTVTLRPAQVLDVSVVHADDGAPVAGARVDIESQLSERHLPMHDIAQARTDGRGRVQVIPGPGIAYRLHIYPPEGEPYVPALREIQWPKAAVRQSVDVKLSRGAVVRGRLIEDPAGTPVVGGWVVYHQTFRNNPRFRYLPSIEAVSGPEATFTMVVPYGPGHLLVQGPSAAYLHVPTSANEMGIGVGVGLHMYPDAHDSLEIKDGQATHPLELRLRRGVPITGRVLTPDGRPVAEAFAMGRSYAPYQEGHDPLTPFGGDAPRIEVKDGRFAIPGCDPEKPGTFYFLDLKDKLGATVELSGRSAEAGPVTVRLQPTASARIRLTGADGRPLANCDAGQGFNDLRLVITPGPDFAAIQDNPDLTIGDFEYHVNLDLVRQSGLLSGADGRATISSLIPGAPYGFHGRDFRPESGQTADLGDVVIAKPPR